MCELHAHLGAAIPPSILWSLAHQQGFRMPTKNYWEFERMITAHHTKHTVQDVDELTTLMYEVTHLIQSSPEALPSIIQHATSGAYRHNNMIWQEWRVNPMRRNKSGERDLDHIIIAMLYGLDRVRIEYPHIRIGLIFELYRGYSPRENEIILEKAIKYKDRGIIAVDISGPQIAGFAMKDHAHVFQKAREAGFGLTIHTGEEGGIQEMEYVVDEIAPDRIGHGILAYKHPALMKKLVERNIVLEHCPTSNLNCSVLRDVDELRKAVRTLVDHGVRITLNTDGPEMHSTSLLGEYELMRSHGILSDEELEEIRRQAFTASFLNDIPYRLNSRI
jgi:adenosine deaminase